MLEMANEGARVRVKTQGRKGNGKGEEWEQSYAIWQRNKRETRRAQRTADGEEMREKRVPKIN